METQGIKIQTNSPEAKMNNYPSKTEYETAQVSNWLKIVGKQTGYKFNAIVHVKDKPKYKVFLRNLYRTLCEHYRLYVVVSQNVFEDTHQEIINSTAFRNDTEKNNLVVSNCTSLPDIDENIRLSKAEFVLIDNIQSIALDNSWINNIKMKHPEKRFIFICKHSTGACDKSQVKPPLNKLVDLQLTIRGHDFIFYKFTNKLTKNK